MVAEGRCLHRHTGSAHPRDTLALSCRQIETRSRDTSGLKNSATGQRARCLTKYKSGSSQRLERSVVDQLSGMAQMSAHCGHVRRSIAFAHVRPIAYNRYRCSLKYSAKS